MADLKSVLAFSFFVISAAAGFVFCGQPDLGNLMPEQYFKELNKKIQEGDKEAVNTFMHLNRKGPDGEINSMSLIKPYADKGDAWSQYYIGEYYARHYKEEGIHYLKLAVENNYEPAKEPLVYFLLMHARKTGNEDYFTQAKEKLIEMEKNGESMRPGVYKVDKWIEICTKGTPERAEFMKGPR